MSDSGQWLTYAEAAQLLGISTEAVRLQARRGNWPKQRPNKPRDPARVRVPTDLSPPSEVPVVPGQVNGHDPGQEAVMVVAALQAHIEDLRTTLSLERAQMSRREATDAETIAFLRGQIDRLQADQKPPTPDVIKRRWFWWR